MAAQISVIDLLEGLDPEQRQVAQSLSGPVVVFAGAGTGKTRAIIHRIAHGAATGAQDPARTLAVTFTTRAAGEMTRRLAALGVHGVRVRTFHAAAMRQLSYFWPQAIGGQMHEVISSKSALIASAAVTSKIGTDHMLIRDLATEIEWAKSVQVGADDYAQAASAVSRRAPGGLNLEQVASVYAGYERAKRNARRIDFEDVLLLTVAILEENRELRQQVQSSFAHFTVDEFQDVSAVQQRLLDIWLGDRDDICVVGDVAQTIYSFAGANPKYLREFPAKFPGTTVIQLNRCYRCTPQIVAVAEQVIGQASTIVDIRTGKGSALAQRIPLRSQVSDGPEPTVSEYPDETAEARAVIAQIGSLIAAGVPAREIAILVRINALSEVFESELADAGIAYSVRGGRRFFERPEVRKGVSLLRGAARASEGTGSAPQDAQSAIRAILESAGWSAEPPADTGAVREAWESLAALDALAQEVLSRSDDAGLRDVVDEIARRQSAQDAPSVDGVTLASLHAAKGMEWDAVFLVGLVDGVMPMNQALTPDQIDEERRLLYVGITRARASLALSWSRARIPGGRATRKPSRFLVGLAGSGIEKTASTRGPAKKKRNNRKPATCRVCGKALVTGPERSIGRCRTCPSSLNEDLLEQLRLWRSEQIKVMSEQKGKSLPAYLVATDATLEALAELVPANLDELASIPGLGPAKLDQYGVGLLALLDANRGEH
ncbi:MAG: ATP-dependent DNA helicase UvrD2 [Actinomycetes bacterium]